MATKEGKILEYQAVLGSLRTTHLGIIAACQPLGALFPPEVVSQLKALLMKFDAGLHQTERLLEKWAAGGGTDEALASMIHFRILESMSMEVEVRSFISGCLERELVMDFEEPSGKESFRMDAPKWFRKMLGILRGELVRQGQRNIQDWELLLDAVRFAVMNQEAFLAMPTVSRRSVNIIMPRRNGGKSGKSSRIKL